MPTSRNLRGGKAFKKGKKPSAGETDKIPKFEGRDIDQDYARATAMLGNRRVRCFCNDSFEELVVFLRDKKTIKLSKAVLQRFHKFTIALHGQTADTEALGENVNVRVFLASFMIAYRPTHVFEAMGNLENELFTAARELLNCFETMVSTVHGGRSLSQIPLDVTRPFESLLCNYLKCFKAWKVPDEAKLTCRIQHALIALYEAQGHLPACEPAESKLSVEFRTQIARLRDKLKQIAGEAKLREFDNSRAGGTALVGVPLPGAQPLTDLSGRMTNEDLAHQLLLDETFRLQDIDSADEREYITAATRIRQSFHEVTVYFCPVMPVLCVANTTHRLSSTAWRMTSTSRLQSTCAC